MARESGKDIIVLRIPIAHSEPNPSENIWYRRKKYVADRNTRSRTRFNIHKVRELLQEALDSIKPEDWQASIRKVLHIEEKFWKHDHMLDIEPTVEPLNIPTDEAEEESENDELFEIESGVDYSSFSDDSSRDSFSDEY